MLTQLLYAARNDSMTVTARNTFRLSFASS